tara:strand:+ start:283 stop:495 length:213 start_codon:yes stop_codon:yes gene_type:complete
MNDLFTQTDLLLNLTKNLLEVHLTTLPCTPLKKTTAFFQNCFCGILFIITPYLEVNITKKTNTGQPIYLT